MSGYLLMVHDNPGFGGVGHVAAQLASGLEQRGWCVDHWQVRQGPGAALNFAARLARHRGVVLATQSFSAAYASAFVAACARRPWVIWVHGPIEKVLQMAGTGPAKRNWLRWFYRRTTHVVCCSEQTCSSLLEFCGPAAAPGRVDVIRNAASNAFSTGARPDKECRNEIGFVGRLSMEKQPLLALETLRALPASYTLQVVGDGPLMPDVRNAAANEIAAGRVKLAGAETIDANTYRRWDVTLLCSAYEGYPLVPLESLASGVPVVSTPIAAAVEMLGTFAPSMLARAADPFSIAAAVQDLMASDRAQIRSEIERVNRANDPANFVLRWVDLLQELLRG